MVCNLIKLKKLIDYSYFRYLELKKFQDIPHASYSFGFDRLLQSLIGLDSVVDAVPFPRSFGMCQL